MPVPNNTQSMVFDAEIDDRFVAVIQNAGESFGAVLPSTVASDKVVGILQEPVLSASATRHVPGTVVCGGTSYLKMKASDTGTAGDRVKLGTTAGYGMKATPTTDDAIAFGVALEDWSSGSAGFEQVIQVRLTPGNLS